MHEVLSDSLAKDLIGEGVHKGLRVTTSSAAARDAYQGIDKMSDKEWDGVLTYLVDSLRSMNIYLVEIKEGAQ